MTGSSARGWIAAPAALVIVLLASASGAQDEEKTLPSWIPSVGLGFGLQSRDIDGDIDAFLATGAGSSGSSVLTCFTAGAFIGFCDLSASDTRASDGAAFDISGQLMGPSLSSVPLKPRPYVQGGFAWEYDSRTIAEAGFSPSNFGPELFTEPRIHTRLRANPEWLWYAGGGIALQMPIEFTPVFLKVGAHYLEESIVAIGTISRGDGSETGFLQSEAQEGLKVGGIGPSFGVEAEVWRFGPVGVQFAADILMTFPLTGTDAQFDLEAPGDEPPQCSVQPDAIPCVQPAQFDFGADNIHYLGLASFRFAWLGY